jgi:hypothetical protein
MELPADRLPLVIGVTGHRDLRDEDVPRLEQEVAAVIAGLRRDYLRGDKETPIIVLSALAEGADRLVARVALRAGALLIAPLPMPLEEYRRDFEPGLKAGNMQEFDELFEQAIAAPVMPLQGRSLQAIAADHKLRAEQYRAVGIFITQHCHVLLALWDGNAEEMAAGGSAEVVSFKRDGIPLIVSGSPRTSLDASEVGPVIEIVTPRVKETNAADRVALRPWGRGVIRRYRGGIIRRGWRRLAAFAGHILHREVADPRSKLPPAQRRELEGWEHFASLIDLTCHFNRDAAAFAGRPAGPTRLAQSIDYLFTDPEGGTAADADAKAHAMSSAPLWCRLYGIADALAQHRQSQFNRDWKMLIVLGFVAFFCFAMFTHAGYVSGGWFLGAYSAIFLVIFVLFIRAVAGQHQERYLDYRALAEALRVAVYWKLVGIGSRYFDAKSNAEHDPTVDINPVGAIANAYPIKQPSELAWVKVCLRTLERLDKAEGAAPRRIDPVGHAIACKYWVYGQYAYFKGQGLKHNSLAETIEAHSAVLLVLSPFVIAPVLLYFMQFMPDYRWHGLDVQHFILVVIGLLPGVAAAMTAYSERLALKAQARQYDRMRVLFERAYDLLPRTIDDDSTVLAHVLYQELGTEAMRENAEWVAIYRQRPIQPLQ